MPVISVSVLSMTNSYQIAVEELAATIPDKSIRSKMAETRWPRLPMWANSVIIWVCERDPMIKAGLPSTLRMFGIMQRRPLLENGTNVIPNIQRPQYKRSLCHEPNLDATYVEERRCRSPLLSCAGLYQFTQHGCGVCNTLRRSPCRLDVNCCWFAPFFFLTSGLKPPARRAMFAYLSR